MFWSRLFSICEQRKQSPNFIAREIGISSGIVSKWKQAGTLPNGETLKKLADYLNCSVDYLLGRTELPEQSELTPQEEKLLSNNRELNNTGQERLLNYAEDLVDSGKYEKNKTAEAVGSYKLVAFGGDNESYEEDDPQII